MEAKPDVIAITVRHEEDVSADRADLLVTVQGSSIVTGRAALTKAAEVQKLVDELQRVGVTQEEISLEGVHAEVSNGILTKSSSATYRIRIGCRDLELMPAVLGAVTSAKNVRLDDTVWRYPESAEREAIRLEACIAEANIKAAAAAEALGTRVVGIHRLVEHDQERPPVNVYEGASAPGSVMRSGGGSVQLGFELGHRKTTATAVTVEYRVEGYQAPA